MNIREYRESDLPDVMAIANEAWAPIRRMSREALGDAISDRLRPEGDGVSKGLEVKSQLESGQYGILICEHENAVVGFITFKIEGDMGIICNNAAKKETGLKGIGQTMYHALLQLFREKSLKTVQVTTGLDWAHAPARRAYERAGFKRCLDSRTYFMDLEDEN